MRIVSIIKPAFMLFVLLFASVATTASARSFPGNSVQVYLDQVDRGYILANGNVQLKMASGILIFNERNRTIVRGALPSGITVRLLLNGKEEVQRIWILAPDEIEAKPTLTPLTRQRTSAPRSFDSRAFDPQPAPDPNGSMTVAP